MSRSVEQPVLVEGEGHLVHIVLNRPEVLNAINSAMAHALLAACEELASNTDAWVVILRGNGERAFCAGADLRERRDFSARDWQEQRNLFRDMFHALRLLPQPVIAAVHGFALGGGTELALLSDCVVAAEDVEFGLPEARLGIIPGGGGTISLPRLLGPSRAKEAMFSGRRIKAAEALSLGLALRIVPRQQLLTEAHSLAATFMKSSPTSLRAIKQAANGAQGNWAEALELEERSYQMALASQDRQEGIAAFNERREPRWTGY